MVDVARGTPEADTPVNPYSLLEAVNSSSDTAHTGWLIFLAIMTYIMIAVAGVTHQDLLLETPVRLPILQVNIQLKQFFQFAPILLVLFHLGIVAQLVLLARKAIEFDHAIRLLETSERRNHPLRLELHNFFFVQAIAGPQRSAIMGAFLHGMTWLTLVILPVVLLLYIQVVFLPYHDVATTWVHRVALVVDIAVLLLIGVFLLRAETSFFQAFGRTTATHPIGAIATTLVLSLVVVLSFFAATVPGEAMDRMTRAMFGGSGHDAERKRTLGGFNIRWLGVAADGSLLGLFRRNLIVTDADLVVDKDVTPGEPTLNLRGRDLTFAILDRSDLHQADFTGSNLDYASLAGADLRNVWIQCADLTQFLLSDDRDAARCPSAREASFARARLGEARLSGVDLTGADFEEAQLEGASLAFSVLTGADFSNANLDKADLTGGVQAQGANFLLAALQGADFTGAQLQRADFASASLQGAHLSRAHLQGSILRDADLEGASLRQAKLQGADLTGANITAADFRGAAIWMAQPPRADANGLADFADLANGPLDETDMTALKALQGRLASGPASHLVTEGLAPLMNPEESQKWSGSTAQWAWQSLAAPPTVTNQFDTYKTRLTDYLTKAMCKPRFANGSMATGVALRAQSQQFQGDTVAVFDRLKASDCPAGKSVTAKVLRDLGAAADALRSP